MNGMDDDGNTGTGGGEAADDPGLGTVGMHDVVLSLGKQPSQRPVGGDVADRVQGAHEVRLGDDFQVRYPALLQ